MSFKINIKKESEMQSQSFSFNVLSKPEGLVLWLTDYKIKAEGSKPRRWSHVGDNGTFLKRTSITIPDDVLADAKARCNRSSDKGGISAFGTYSTPSINTLGIRMASSLYMIKNQFIGCCGSA